MSCSTFISLERSAGLGKGPEKVIVGNALTRLAITGAEEDPVCRRMMWMPGIGALVTRTYRSAMDALRPVQFLKKRLASRFA